MRIRVIYYDLSEWHGDSAEFNNSPHKGVLAISLTYSDNVHRHLMTGPDYYYVKDDEIGFFNGDEKELKIIKLLGVGKEKVEVKPISSLDLAFLRMGVWVRDRVMRIANKRIAERVK